MPSLSDIPFLGGYMQTDAVNRGREAQQLAQAGQFATLQGHFQDQEAKQAARQREAVFRQRMAAATTDAEREQIAMESEGPKGILSHLDRASRDRATQAQRAATLAQSASQFDQNMQLRWTNAKTAQEKAMVEAQWKQGRLALETAQAQIAGKNLQYNTGQTVDIPQTPQLTMPGAPPAMPSEVMRGQAPDEAAAIAALGGATNPTGIRGSIEIPTQSPAAAVGAPTGPGAWSAPQAPVPAPANNFNARDLRAQAAQTSVPVVPVPGQGVPAARAAAIPMPPDIAAMPKRKQDEWRMAQEKANAKLNINLAGGRESTFINRVVLAGNQAAADLANVVKLPMSASRGLFGGRGQGTSLFDAAKESLATAMTTQEVQSYNVLATGFQRSLAAIEAAGLAPSGTLVHQMDSVIFKEGDTNYTKLLKLAQTRQIVDKGLETTLSNPRVPEETKAHIREIMAKIDKAVPFLPADLMDLQQAQSANPQITLGDILKQKKQQSSPAWSDEKETRYQELLRKQRGGT